MTTKERLILFHINNDPGIRDIYRMVKIYDQADFPFGVGEHLNLLLKNEFIGVSKYFNNKTPSHYYITEKGKKYLNQHFNDKEIIEYIKRMRDPSLLLRITQSYIDKGTCLE